MGDFYQFGSKINDKVGNKVFLKNQIKKTTNKANHEVINVKYMKN